MRNELKVFSLVFMLALIFFLVDSALGDIRADMSLDPTVKDAVSADTAYRYGFEYGWSGWSADNGVWEVGHPDSVVVPHSGYNCAGTVLNGPYPNTSSRLVSPAITLPSIGTGEALRLRFWHWFKIAGYDVGRIQIQVDTAGAPWQTISNDCIGQSPYWTPAEIEISTYTGMRVRFGFYLVQQGYGYPAYVDWGWYIDDMCVIKTPSGVTAPVCWDFESGWGDWWADNGVWEVGYLDSLVYPHSGLFLVGTALNNFYPNTSSRLVSPAVNLPTIDSLNEALHLSFWHWFKIAGYDRGQVQISVDSADKWQPWKPISGDYIGQSPHWTLDDVGILAYAGKRVRIGFYLIQQGYGYPDYVDWGWYVDDACFAIIPDTVAVASPNGGECWGVGLGLKHTVNWNWDDRSGHFLNVKIELSRDAGRTWETLDSSTYNDGFWQGVIAGSPSDSCLIRVSDPSDGFPADTSIAVFTLKDIAFVLGDANGDVNITVADVVYLVNYLFKGGTVPNPLEAGDANNDGKVTIADAVYLVNFLFKGGPVPACTW